MTINELREKIMRGRCELECMRAEFRERLEAECPALPSGWRWVDVGPDMVTVGRGSAELAICHGNLMVHGDVGSFSLSIVDAMRETLGRMESIESAVVG